MRAVGRRVAPVDPPRPPDVPIRLRPDGDRVDVARGATVRLELDGRGPTVRLEDDGRGLTVRLDDGREVAFRLLGVGRVRAGLIRAGLVDLRTGAERGAALRVVVGRLRRVLLVDGLAGVGRVMDEDRPGIELERLLAGAGERPLVAGAVRVGVRLGSGRDVFEAPRFGVVADWVRVGFGDEAFRDLIVGRGTVDFGEVVSGLARDGATVLAG